MPKQIQLSEYLEIFNCSPVAILVLDIDAPHFTILDVNEGYLEATNTTRDTLIGKSVFGAFPANPSDKQAKNIQDTVESFQKVIGNKKRDIMPNYRYDIPIRGTDRFELRYWTTINTPKLDEDGNVKYIIHSPANVTELNLLAEREKTALSALKDQRKQLYSVFMQAPVGIGIFLGSNYIVDLINPPLCELYGKTVEEMHGRPVFDVLTHAKGLGFEQLLDQVMATGIPFHGRALAVPLVKEAVLENVYVNFVYEPFRSSDGQIIGVIAIATEITDQINAAQRLEVAEERARLAVDAVGLGTFDQNLQTGETITSTIFANIFGFDAPIPSEQYIKHIHPDDIEIRTRAYHQALSTGNLFYEARLVWQDGTMRWIRIDGKVFYDEQKPKRLLGTVLDITDQVLAKQEQEHLIKLLAEREQLLQNITSASPTGLWMADEDGVITYVNQTWTDWTGVPYEKQLGAGWVSTILADDREKTANKFYDSLRKKSQYEAEFRFMHIDGKLRWCVASGRPQYASNGTFSGYIGALVDITEQKELQRQKDDFIGIASHELKTPVTSIKAYVQVLERMLLKDGRTTDAALMGKMDAQINRLTSLIGDLLDVTKMNTGKLQFNDREFDFSELINELLEDLQHSSEKHTLVYDKVSSAVVYGDKERIGQVITNLVTNAVKYSPNADKIIISTSIQDNQMILCVRDFGIGIAKKNIDRLFEQFYRVSGDVQHTFPGLGLGLYISSEIIKRENGRIWVESTEGKGSTFCFSLPIKQQSGHTKTY